MLDNQLQSTNIIHLIVLPKERINKNFPEPLVICRIHFPGSVLDPPIEF